MKCARIQDNIVQEIFPGSKDDLRDIFHPDILAMCVAIEDDSPAEPNWIYDPDTDTFAPPPEPQPEPEMVPPPDPQADADAMMVDHEYRLTLLELGVM